MAKVSGIVVDVNRGTVYRVEVARELGEYYRLIGCDCIDIVMEQIGGVLVNVVVDDEGLLKDDPRLAIWRQDGGLYGSVLVLGFDRDEMDVRGLTEDEMRTVEGNVRKVMFADGTVRQVLVSDDMLQ